MPLECCVAVSTIDDGLIMVTRHPGVDWLPVTEAIGKKVVHIGACLGPSAPLYCRDCGGLQKPTCKHATDKLPMGWSIQAGNIEKAGIIDKKSARQLRKWITRAGKKDDEYLRKNGNQGEGRVSTFSSLGTKVVWLDPPPMTLPVAYFKTGEDQCGFYELILSEEEEDLAQENAFEDGAMIHSGGSLLVKMTSFFVYFVPQVTRFIFGWLIFFSYFGLLYFFEYSIVAYSVTLASGSSYAMPGRLYNAEPGDQFMLHVDCKGYTRNSPDRQVVPEDGRPPVIIESMEALGMGVAMRGLQEKIAESGVCCVYDRCVNMLALIGHWVRFHHKRTSSEG